MVTAELKRHLKIYCPTHQSIFEIEENPHIICDIKEHALSNNFPCGESWEYCCDCQTFPPSHLEIGGRAKDFCPHCERKTAWHFLCDECQIITYDSGEYTKGKNFHLNSDTKTLIPSCPGCLKIFSVANSYLHKCDEAKMTVLTSRKTCLFCKKEIAVLLEKKFVLPIQPKNQSTETKSLNSVCPLCGLSKASDSIYCINCKQSLKTTTSNQPLLPPNIPPIPTQIVTTSVIDVSQQQNWRLMFEIGLKTIFVIGFVGLVIWMIAFKSSSFENSNNLHTNSNTKISNSSGFVEKTPMEMTNTNATQQTETEQLKKEIVDGLNTWKSNAESFDLSAYMSNYADRVDYYNKMGASNDFVYENKQKAFAKYDSIKINLDYLTITSNANGDRAIVIIDKEWNFSNADEVSSGKVKQQLTLKRINRQWLIVGEKDLKLYYVNK